MQRLTIPTVRERQIVDITAFVNDLLQKNFYDTGICFLFVTHTSCALTISDMDPGIDLDLMDAYDAIVPKLPYRHVHGTAHVGEHVLSSIIGTSLTVPVSSASLDLGAKQRIILIELNGPKERRISVNFLPTK